MNYTNPKICVTCLKQSKDTFITSKILDPKNFGEHLFYYFCFCSICCASFSLKNNKFCCWFIILGKLTPYGLYKFENGFSNARNISTRRYEKRYIHISFITYTAMPMPPVFQYEKKSKSFCCHASWVTINDALNFGNAFDN